MKLVDITTKPSKLVAAVDKIHSRPYPGINADNLPFFAVICTQAAGQTLIHDWMYEKLASAYVFDETNRAFMAKSNPWALRGVAERLLEAADRGLWESPGDATLAGLKQTYLELEGDLEGG